MHKAMNDLNDKSNILPEEDNFRKTLILTAGFGGIFGLLVTVLVFSMYGFPAPILSYMIGIPFFCAFISGLAGISSIYINRLLIKIGIISLVTRQITGTIIVILIAMCSGLIIAAYLGFLDFKGRLPFITTTTIIGFIFGVVVIIVNNRLWNMRQQVLTLQIENKYLAELAVKDQQLQEATKNLIITEERNRMARDLHDSISQGIHGIIYTVHSLRQHLQSADEKTKEILTHLETTVSTTLSELRSMILELKPSLLEERGLMDALKLHCELFAKRLKIKCDLILDETAQISPQHEMAIYRIVQEALANIQQHAGADKVIVQLSSVGDYLKLRIEDNGKGFVLKDVNRGNGLDNMEARCRENAGILRIETEPAQGTAIEAAFPVQK